jgi:hypothetical protein
MPWADSAKAADGYSNLPDDLIMTRFGKNGDDSEKYGKTFP